MTLSTFSVERIASATKKNKVGSLFNKTTISDAYGIDSRTLEKNVLMLLGKEDGSFVQKRRYRNQDVHQIIDTLGVPCPDFPVLRKREVSDAYHMNTYLFYKALENDEDIPAIIKSLWRKSRYLFPNQLKLLVEHFGEPQKGFKTKKSKDALR